MSKIKVNGICVFYHHRLIASSPTIMEHANSFRKYSKFDIYNVNTELGFPRKLSTLDFDVIVLHYSLFGNYPFNISNKFLQYFKQLSTSKKICFFQDEHQFVQERFNLINQLNIDIIYTQLPEHHFKEIYYNNTVVKKVYQTLTGYVDNETFSKFSKFYKPFEKRKIDFGYRARKLPYFMGAGAREKTEIAKVMVPILKKENYG